MNLSLPQFVQRRRGQCRACPHATTRNFGGRVGVTLADTCVRVGDDRQFVALVGDPDFACPIGRFAKAIVGGGETQGLPIVERGEVVGFKPLKFSTKRPNRRPSPHTYRQIVIPSSPSLAGGCGGCGNDGGV